MRTARILTEQVGQKTAHAKGRAGEGREWPSHASRRHQEGTVCVEEAKMISVDKDPVKRKEQQWTGKGRRDARKSQGNEGMNG